MNTLTEKKCTDIKREIDKQTEAISEIKAD